MKDSLDTYAIICVTCCLYFLWIYTLPVSLVLMLVVSVLVGGISEVDDNDRDVKDNANCRVGSVGNGGSKN